VDKLTVFLLLNGGAGAPRTPGKDEAASGTLPSPQAVKPECNQHPHCPPNPQTRNHPNCLTKNVTQNVSFPHE